MRPKTCNFLLEVKTAPSAWIRRSKPGKLQAKPRDLASEEKFNIKTSKYQLLETYFLFYSCWASGQSIRLTIGQTHKFLVRISLVTLIFLNFQIFVNIFCLYLLIKKIYSKKINLFINIEYILTLRHEIDILFSSLLKYSFGPNCFAISIYLKNGKVLSICLFLIKVFVE